MKFHKSLFSTEILAMAIGGAAPSQAEQIIALSNSEITDILYMREEEKLARDTYLTLFQKWSELTALSNIAASEQSHMDAMLNLSKNTGLKTQQ